MVATEFPETVLLRNAENVGFGPANNQAMAAASGRYFLLLNSDTYLTDDSVVSLFARVNSEPEIGVAQCRLWFPDGRLQYTAYRFPSLSLILFEALGMYKLFKRRAPGILLRGYWDHATERDVDWVIGAFMLMPRKVYEQTQGFDESLFLYGEDREWCFRIRQRGWRIRFYPSASIVHVGHASSNISLGLSLQRDRDFFIERFGRGRATVMMVALVAGAAARAAYYAARAAVGGGRAEAYGKMRPELNATFAILCRLTLGHDYAGGF
jgi:GT2 family glycosyltransferase